jgi:hypothetical protein
MGPQILEDPDVGKRLVTDDGGLDRGNIPYCFGKRPRNPYGGDPWR